MQVTLLKCKRYEVCPRNPSGFFTRRVSLRLKITVQTTDASVILVSPVSLDDTYGLKAALRRTTQHENGTSSFAATHLIEMRS